MLSQLASDLEAAGRYRMNKEELAAALSQALLEPKALLPRWAAMIPAPAEAAKSIKSASELL
jgi:hypothetical protein